MLNKMSVRWVFYRFRALIRKDHWIPVHWVRIPASMILILLAFGFIRAQESQWTLLSSGAPVARTDHAMIYDPEHARVLVFGGRAWIGSGARQPLWDAWELNATGWQRISGHPPEEDYYALALDESRRCIYMFASRYGSLSMYDSPEMGFVRGTYMLGDGEWDPIPVDNPPARSGFNLCYDTRRKKIVLFGGRIYRNSRWNYLNDTWEFDGKVWNLVAKNGPSGRAGYGAAYDETSGNVLLFGGEDEKTRFGDTWKWDGHDWKRAVTGGPSPRSMAPMVYDNNRKRVVLFGGRASENLYLGDTWEWNGTEWHQVSGIGPKPRIGHAMVYNQSLKRVQLFGGQSAMETGLYGDLWEWDGSRWLQRIQPLAPSQIALNKMVPFPPGGGILLLLSPA